MKDFCVCILAHNEQRHIGATVRAIAENCDVLACDIKVYANGCTDRTVDIIRELCLTIPHLRLRELGQASKPLAWNTAFSENHHPVLVFSDGDVVPESGAINALCRPLTEPSRRVILVGCSLWPRQRGLGLGQRLTGFMQIPVRQDFLAGGLYAVHRQSLAREFAKRNISGIPAGVTADDTFLQLLVPEDRFLVIRQRVFYEPPQLRDYWKYLARVRWQEEQLAEVFGGLFSGQVKPEQAFMDRCKGKFKGKFIGGHGGGRFLIGLLAATLRMLVKAIFWKRIHKCYQALGPVVRQGDEILSQATRSRSAK